MRLSGHSALVIGAGIAGQAAAHALAEAGLRVTIVDRARPYKPTRALSLWRNGRAALARLIGDAEAARLSTHALDLVEVRSFAGDPLWTFPAGAWSGAGSARSVWHDDLLDRLSETQPPAIEHHPGTLWHLVDDGVHVHAVLRSGDELQADIVIGTDGLASRVREQLLGAEPPHDLGQEMTCDRLDLAALPLLECQRLCGPGQLLGPGRAFACQSEDARFIATRLGDEISWMATCLIGQTIDHAFAGAAQAVRDLIARRDPDLRPFRLHDRPVAARWVRGGVALLGESAHPMTPELGQGACLTLEDAVVLGDSVRAHGPRPGLAVYERVRRPRVDWITRLAHQMAVTSLPKDRRLAGLRDWLLPRAAPPLARAVFDRLIAWP